MAGFSIIVSSHRGRMLLYHIVPVMQGADGKPKPELFLADMLHMNRAGYELWIPVVKATIEKDAGPPSATPAKP